VIDLWLHPGRDRSVRRRHPWILSGAVARTEGEGAPGDWVRVRSAEGSVLAFGHLSPASGLRVRLLSFGEEPPGDEIWDARIGAAVSERELRLGIGETDALRLVNAEGDGLPGLVADRYGDTVVVKLLSAGAAARRERIADALRRASGAARGFERADPASARREGLPARQGPLWGEPLPERIAIRERKREHVVDVAGGQKTGFYLDQRDARDRVEALAAGRRVLDLFAYTGAFSVAAAAGGAAELTLVESSADALALAQESLARAAPELPVRLERADAFRFARADRGAYDLVVVDPPPLARQRRDVPRATRALKDVVLHALYRAAPGALLLVFSCSHPVGADLLQKVVFGAALDAGRELRILGRLSAPADHPVSIYHPEGSYLSGLLLRA